MLKFCTKKALLISVISLLAFKSFADCDFREAERLQQLIQGCVGLNDYYIQGCISYPMGFGPSQPEYKVVGDATYFVCRTYTCDGRPTSYVSVFPAPISSQCIIDLTPPNTTPTTLAINNQTPVSRCGSIIQTSNQVIGETISLTGVPFYLTHFSSRATGRIGDYSLKFPLTNPKQVLPVQAYSVDVLDRDNNRLSTSNFNNSPGQKFSYQWDGKINGLDNWATAKLTFVVKTTAVDNSVSNNSFTLVMGNLKAKKLGLGGWLPSIWHFYDSAAGKIYDGDGNARNVKAVQEGIYNRVASSDGSEVYYFDSIGRLAITRTGLTGSVLYTFNYDPTSQKLLNITDAFNKVTKFKYDSNGNLSQIISPENIRTNFTVDQNGYLKTVTNPKNETYTMTYKDAGGLLSSFTKPNGVQSTFTYDTDGNLLTDINSGGMSSTLSKTDSGVNAVSAMGRLTQNNYDASKNTEVEIRPSGLATTYVNAPDTTSVTNVISVTKSNIAKDPRFGDQVLDYSQTVTQNFGTTTTNIENAVDLNDLTNPFSVSTLTKTTTEGSSEMTSHYDGLTRTQTLTTKLGRSLATQVDSLERPILEQIGNNIPTKYTYQSDLLTKISQDGRETKFSYDPSTKLLTSMKNSLNLETNFYYDQAQRLRAKRLPDGRVINFQYDSNNNLVSITPPGRPAHKEIYGANEMLASYNPPALSGVANVNTVYSYNLDKDLTKITRPDGEAINFNYNQTTGLLDSISGSFGVIAREYQNEQLKKITDQNGQVMNLGYTGRIVSSLSSNDYQYSRTPSQEAAGLVGNEVISAGNKSQQLQYTYDDDKALVQAQDLSLSYNTPNGQLVKTALNNVTEEYAYNKFGEVISYKAKFKKSSGTEKILYSYALTRDQLGRIVSKTETFADGDKDKDQDKKEDKREKKEKEKDERESDHDDRIVSIYEYDFSGRLVHVHGEKRRPSHYRYDFNSNRIEGLASGEEFKAIYDNQDRLIRMNNVIYSYNANGDLLSKSEQVKCDRDDRDSKKAKYNTTSFVYDVFGNLKQAGKVTYKIDPLGRRSARLVNGVVTNKYIYNPEGQLIGELDPTGNLTKTFVYASKSHVPDYFIDSNNNRFKLVVDQLGSVRLVVNATTGEVKEKMLHDEFGRVLKDTRPNYIPFGFAGGLYDSETKLVRFGMRDYNPETGRWMSKDPIRFKGGDTNLYGYVLTDPVNKIDPLGKEGVVVQIGFGDCLSTSLNNAFYDSQPSKQKDITIYDPDTGTSSKASGCVLACSGSYGLGYCKKVEEPKKQCEKPL